MTGGVESTIRVRGELRLIVGLAALADVAVKAPADIARQITALYISSGHFLFLSSRGNVTIANE